MKGEGGKASDGLGSSGLRPSNLRSWAGVGWLWASVIFYDGFLISGF